VATHGIRAVWREIGAFPAMRRLGIGEVLEFEHTSDDLPDLDIEFHVTREKATWTRSVPVSASSRMSPAPPAGARQSCRDTMLFGLRWVFASRGTKDRWRRVSVQVSGDQETRSGHIGGFGSRTGCAGLRPGRLRQDGLLADWTRRGQPPRPSTGRAS
jgi:hypothetical protein